MLPAYVKVTSPPAIQQQDSSDDLLLSNSPEKDLAEGKTIVTSTTDDCSGSDLVSAISDLDFATSPASFRVSTWDKQTKYSDYIRSGLEYLKRTEADEPVIMLFEAPSTASDVSSFFNSQSWAFHDYPPSSTAYKYVQMKWRQCHARFLSC